MLIWAVIVIIVGFRLIMHEAKHLKLEKEQRFILYQTQLGVLLSAVTYMVLFFGGFFLLFRANRMAGLIAVLIYLGLWLRGHFLIKKKEQ